MNTYDRVAPVGFDFDSKGLANFLGHKSTRTLDDWAYKKINIPYAVVAGKRWYRKSDADHYLFRREVKVSPPKQRR